MATWDQIKKKVEANDNILTITMIELRDAAGKDKLGVHVRSEISKTLACMGLGHVPKELPPNQHELARLYKRGTPVGELIEMVLSPGEQNDSKLKQQFSNSSVDYANIIEQIPKLPQPETIANKVKTSFSLNDSNIEIRLTTVHTPKKYSLIPISKEIRHFFPGYKVPFILETDIGEIETHVTSAPQGTPIGTPDAGNYIVGGLKPWYKRHHSLTDGSTLVIEKINAGKRYRLNIKK